MATFRLVGGPCDGNIVDATLLKLKPGDPVDCGGVRYIWNGGATANATSLPTTGSGGGAVPGQRQVGSAWHAWMRAMAHKMPAALNRSAAGRRAMKRAVR